MHNYGDITKIDGCLVEPVDIVTGGSPCQNFSTTGNRKGLAGEQSSLFFEMIRVVSEMRKASGKPRFVIFENVVGLLFCNNGFDFHTVLISFSNIACPSFVVPQMPCEGWTKAGCIKGNDWSIAWRVCNSVFWGLKQRRRRIMLLVDFESVDADKILFGKRESFASRGSNEKTIALCSDLFSNRFWSEYGWEGMNSSEEPDVPISNNINELFEKLVPEKYNPSKKTVSTLLKREAKFNCSENCKVVEKVLTSIAQKKEWFHIRGKDIAAFRDNPFLFLLQSFSGGKIRFGRDCFTIRTLSLKNRGDPTFGPVVMEFDCHRNKEMFDRKNAETLYKISCRNTQKDNTVLCSTDGAISIRFLTPNEYERLFGYPAGWTSAYINDEGNVVETDHDKRIEMLGNSIAIPQWQWLMERIKNTSGAKTMASLFDGIGGFPHCAKLNGIIPVWCSEIDKIASGISELWFGDVEQKTKG